MTQGPFPFEPAREPWSSAFSVKVDANTATREQLMLVPSISPELADQIIEHRPFRRWEDLELIFRLDGRGMAAAKDHLSLGGAR